MAGGVDPLVIVWTYTAMFIHGFVSGPVPNVHYMCKKSRAYFCIVKQLVVSRNICSEGVSLQNVFFWVVQPLSPQWYAAISSTSHFGVMHDEDPSHGSARLWARLLSSSEGEEFAIFGASHFKRQRSCNEAAKGYVLVIHIGRLFLYLPAWLHFPCSTSVSSTYGNVGRICHTQKSSNGYGLFKPHVFGFSISHSILAWGSWWFSALV